MTFDPYSLIVKSIFDCPLSDALMLVFSAKCICFSILCVHFTVTVKVKAFEIFSPDMCMEAWSLSFLSKECIFS